MATRRSTAKEKGEWSSETIAEWSVSKALSWKAQISTAPDGGKFIGVRQYVTTAKLGEIAGKGGISIKLDENAGESLRKIRELLEALQFKLSRPSLNKRKSESKDQFFLVKDNGKYLTSIGSDGIKVSSDGKRAQLFTRERAQSLLDDRLSDAWSLKHFVA